MAQLGLTDKVELINPGNASAEHGSSVGCTVEEGFKEQEADLMFSSSVISVFLDQLPLTLSLLNLCILHARHGLLACSIDDCTMFPNNSTVPHTPPCLLTLLWAVVEFTYRTRVIHVPLIVPIVSHLWSLLNLENFPLTGKNTI